MTLKDIKDLSTDELLKYRDDLWALGNSKFAGLVDREIRYRAQTGDEAASLACGASAKFAR
jgi:hypothetical protein